MLNLSITPDRDSSNTYPKEGGTIIYITDDNELVFKMIDPDRTIILSEQDTKALLKLLKFTIE